MLKDNHAYLAAEVARRTAEVQAVQDTTILAMGSLAETRDNETASHIKRTQHYIRSLAEHLQGVEGYAEELPDEQIENLFKSAPLHDIGKVGIPDSILLKPANLSAEEFETRKTHTTLGKITIELAEEALQSPSTFLQTAKDIAYCHHEKWDGSGYPQGLSGAQNPLAISHQSGLEEGGLPITSLDLRSTLQQAALAGGLIMLAGLVLLVGTGGALVLLVRQQLMRHLVTLTRTDSLTGLLNRDAWLETVGSWLGEQEAARTPVVIAIAGLDRFKDLNARHGYLAGDRVLKTLSRDLQGLRREGAWLARLSGDQFGLALLGGTEQAARPRGLCEALAAEPLVVEPGPTARITLSAGMTSGSSPAGWQLNALLAHADRNLRAAKDLGGNQVMNA